MADLFSDAWMQKFMQEWNNEPDLSDALAEIGFNSTIAYGVAGEAAPRGFIKVENGKVAEAGSYGGSDVNWDMRASEDSWNKWISSGIGMTKLGLAAASGKLKFKTGDYGAMLKNPKMAAPFIKSFDVMGRV